MLSVVLAFVAAAGSVLSAYIAAKVREVATISNGRLQRLELEITRLTESRSREREVYRLGREASPPTDTAA